MSRADDVRFDVRYASEVTRDNLFDETVEYQKPLLPWLKGDAAVRLSESFFAIRTFEYKAEGEVPVTSFLGAHLRLNTVSYLPEGMGSTQLLFYLRGQTSVGPVSLHLSLGFWERFISITSIPILVTFSRSYPDSDFAVDFGVHVQLTPRIGIETNLATFESIDVFNLHNPFVLLSADYTPKDKPWKVFLYARDRILLGFGRRDELLFGLGYQLVGISI